MYSFILRIFPVHAGKLFWSHCGPWHGWPVGTEDRRNSVFTSVFSRLRWDHFRTGERLRGVPHIGSKTSSNLLREVNKYRKLKNKNKNNPLIKSVKQNERKLAQRSKMINITNKTNIYIYIYIYVYIIIQVEKKCWECQKCLCLWGHEPVTWNVPQNKE